MCDQCDGEQYRVQVRVGSRVEIDTDLRHAPSHVQVGVLGALSAHLQVADEVGDLLKAGKADTDPRYGVLEQLIQQARRDWSEFGEKLVDQVHDLLRSGTLDADGERALEEIFRAHEAAIILRFAGVGDSEARDRAIRNGYFKPGEVIWSHVDIAYRAARGLELLRASVQEPDPVRQRAQIRNVIDAFARQPLTERDDIALTFARERAALKMRRPIRQAADGIRELAIPMKPPRVYAGTGPRPPGAPDSGATPGVHAASRQLTREEYAKVRPAVERAVLERRTAGQLERDLRDAVAGTPLTNDMERVARTELRDAHAEGAYQTLKAETERLGLNDPEVYKITSPTACADCVRIWGRGGSKRYRLSQVEAWEAQGGNVGKPHQQWGPTIGTVHPNCGCGPLLYFDASTHQAMLTAVDEIMADYPKGG